MRGGSALLEEEEQGGLEVGRAARTDGRTDSSSAISAFDHGEEFSRRRVPRVPHCSRNLEPERLDPRVARSLNGASFMYKST